MTGRIVSPELIGRRAELEVLARAFEDALAGRSRTVLLGGEAGVGKTRLLTAALDEAHEAGALVLIGGCIGLAEGSLPFGPLVEALRPLIRQLDRPLTGDEPGLGGGAQSALRTVAADLGLIAGGRTTTIPAAELRPEWARSRLYEAVLDLLRQLAASRPIVLAIEDLHWADDSTRELLAFLARNAHACPLLIVTTFRTDELHRRHPLLFWLAEVDRLAGIERLDIGRLGRDDVARQVSAILGHRPAPGLLNDLFARSDGNPFYAEELLAAGTQTRRLPPTLREVLAARLAHVSEPTLHVLGVAAVVGRRVDHDLLAEVAGLSETDLFEALREATSSQLLVAEDDPVAERYAFRHALIGEAAAETVLPGQRRRLHVAIAQALEERGDARGAEGAGRLAEIAHHWFEGRELGRAFAASVTAGDRALETRAYAEALGQYDRALELWDVVEVASDRSELDRHDLIRRAAQAGQLAGDFDRAVGLLREALSLVDPAADPVRAGILSERLGRAYWTSGELDLALGAYRRAVDLVPDGPASADRARVLAGYAQVLMLASRFRESLEVGREAHAMSRAVADRQIEGHASTTMGLDLAYVGDLEAGLGLIREGLAIADEVRNWDDIGRAIAALSSALDLAGRLEEATAVALEGSTRLRTASLGGTYGAFLQTNAADSLCQLGRWDEALALAQEVEPFTAGVGRIFAHQVMARLRTGRGEFDGARHSLDVAGSTLGVGVDTQFNGPLAVTRMELASWTGDQAAGRAAADDAIALLASTEDAVMLGWVLAHAIRIEADLADRARAAREVAGVNETAQRSTHLLGLVRAIPHDELDAAVGRTVSITKAFAEAEAGRAAGSSQPDAWLRAAELAGARPLPYQAAYARYRQAEALLAGKGKRATIVQHLRAARATAVELGAQPLREAIEGLAGRARIPLAVAAVVPDEPTEPGAAPMDALSGYGLTTRELEVLTLLAAGRTNRQIAEELYISESTAGVHVSHILGKLGVGGRVEAATIAARLGLAG